MAIKEDELMYVSDMAGFLRKTPNAIRNLVLRRSIPHRKICGRLVFLKSEIEEWIENAPGVRPEDLK